MYMNPTIPIVTPVLQPLVETFVKENVIAKDAVRLILMIVLVTAISATVGFPQATGKYADTGLNCETDCTLPDQCSDSRNHLHADRRCSQFRNSDRCQRIFRWQIRRCGYQNFIRLCFSPRMVKRTDRSCARTPHRRTVYADL